MNLKLLPLIIMVSKYMMYSILMLCVFINTLWASTGNAQNAKSVKEVYLEVGFKDATVLETFALIESKTDYKFSYDLDDLPKNVRISIKHKRQNVANILKEVSKKARLKFRQINNNISVDIVPETDKIGAVEIIFKDVEVTGKVLDENGIGLVGVNIKIKGTSSGTITDIDGNYSLNVPDEDVVLIFSFVGYLSEEITVGSKNVINMQLIPDLTNLSEIVVTAYGQTTRRKLTGAVEMIDSKKLEQVPVVSFDNILQGRASGVLVTPNNGQPGGSTTVRIRGIGSIGAGSAPLYVVDGVPIRSGSVAKTTQTSNVLASLNPNEIESISILKDAAAASIYGSRAANGVVLITTKKGTSGKTKFNFRTQHGISDLENSNNFKMMNSTQYISLMREGVINAGGNPDDPSSSSTYFPISADTINVDWVNDYALRNARTQQYEMSVSGGSKDTRFFISGAYLEQEGLAINTDFERLSTRINFDHNANEKVNLGVNLSLSHTKQQSRFGQSSLNEPLYGGLFVPPTVPVFASPEQIANGDDFGTGYNFNGLRAIGNRQPIAYSNMNDNETRTARVISNFFGSYEIIPDLNFKSSIGIDYINVREEEYFSQTYNNAIGSPDDIADGREIYTNRFDYVFTNLLTYTKTFDAHEITALAGSEFNKFTREQIDARAEGFPSDDVQVLEAASTPLSTESTRSESSLWGLFSRINYSYSGKYFVDFSIRRDGSSKFGKNTQFGTFWSAGVGYIISEEDFFNFNAINNLKFRGSVGTSGNQSGISNFQARTLYSFDGAAYNTIVGANPGSFPSQLGDTNLTWEKNFVYDVALDFDILDNRISGTIEYYNREASDMLLDVQISRTAGADEIVRNTGDMVNKGWEFTLNTINLERNGFTWSTNFNIAFNKNEVTSLPNGADIIKPLNSTSATANTIIREGEALGTWYIPRWAGVDPASGRPLWYDAEGNVVSSFGEADRVVVGSQVPDFFGGLTNTLEYKGWSLSAFFYFNYGNDVLRHSARAYSSDGANFPRNQDVLQLKRWQKPGDITDVPRFVMGNADGGNNTSTRYLEDGSFIKLRNVSLAYQLPTKLISKAKLQNVRIYLQGQNVLTWTKYREFDPEAGSNSSARGEYPIPRTFTVGINIGF